MDCEAVLRRQKSEKVLFCLVHTVPKCQEPGSNRTGSTEGWFESNEWNVIQKHMLGKAYKFVRSFIKSIYV